MRTHIDIIIGRVIRIHRHAAGLSQRGAGRGIGRSQAMMSRIERGVTPLSVVEIITLCELTHVSAAVMLERIMSASDALSRRGVVVSKKRTSERTIDTINPDSIRDFVSNHLS